MARGDSFEKGDSGAIHLDDRLEKIETAITDHAKDDLAMQSKLWRAISDIKIDAAKSSAKVAVLAGIVMGAVMAVIEWAIKGHG